MDDLKRGYREAEDKAREAWRKADGEPGASAARPGDRQRERPAPAS